MSPQCHYLFFYILTFGTISLIGIYWFIMLENLEITIINQINSTINKEYWNFDLNALIKIQLEADISPNLEVFIKNNLNQLTQVYDSKLTLSEQVKHYGSMASTAVDIKITENKSLIFIFTRVWYSKVICPSACNPDRSYLYGQVLTNDYRPTTYNMSLANGQIIRFPSILNISQIEVNECCLGPEDPRIIVNENNQILISFNMVDADKKRKIWFYDIFKHHQVPFTISNHSILPVEKNWSPFLKDNKLHFIYSYNPLKILQCSTEQGTCMFILETQKTNDISSLRGGTQLVRFRDSSYYIGIARTTIYCTKCQRFYRPHLFILSTVDEQFRIVYVSEPLMLDSIPAFAFYFMSEKKSNDFCHNIIRIMTPGSIVSWKWAEDKLIFTLSINDMKSYLISIVGIRKVVENIISQFEKDKTVRNENMVSRSEILAIKYCKTISETNKRISDKMTMIKQ